MSQPVRKRNEHVDRTSETALLVVDMIADFDFEDGDDLYENTRRILTPLCELRTRAQAAGVPTIFVNDNFGRWQEDFRAFRENLRNSSERAREIIDHLGPNDDDYFVLKPQRSAFYSTVLEVLLQWMKVETLILTGITTDICILFTAHDAYMRGFHVHVPSDCAAATRREFHEQALELLRRVADARTAPSTSISFD